ncbi:MAG: site-2 protease family protein [Bdellovibrionaceae bacterium]|nr:site-2 protease family protein [Pseudobdellovibrionaceae bacterium]
MDFVEIGMKVGVFYVPFLFALCFHEFSHAWMAKKRGDRTAEFMGRLTLNPSAHMDWIGTFVLPLSALLFNLPIFFGWAKPVPYDPRNLKNPRVDAFWIALAGPASNFLLAGITALVIGLLFRLGMGFEFAKSLIQVLSFFVTTNLFLGFFNAIPLHPLDGGKILARFLPHHINEKLEDNAHITSLVLMALIFTGALGVLAVPVFWTRDLLLGLALRGAL